MQKILERNSVKCQLLHKFVLKMLINFTFENSPQSGSNCFGQVSSAYEVFKSYETFDFQNIVCFERWFYNYKTYKLTILWGGCENLKNITLWKEAVLKIICIEIFYKISILMGKKFWEKQSTTNCLDQLPEYLLCTVSGLITKAKYLCGQHIGCWTKRLTVKKF